MSRTAEVLMVCRNPECTEDPDAPDAFTFTAKIEHTPEGIFFLDGTDHCPTCGQPGERDDD